MIDQGELFQDVDRTWTRYNGFDIGIRQEGLNIMAAVYAGTLCHVVLSALTVEGARAEARSFIDRLLQQGI